MTNCKECGGNVADSAKVCPHCGVAEPGGLGFFGSRFAWIFGVAFWIIVAFVVIALAGS